MGRHRKLPENVIQLSLFDDAMLDKVTLKTKPYFIEQVDGTWPPYAQIIGSRTVARRPRPLGRRGEHKPEFLSDKFPQMRYQKYCSGCAEWVDKWKFGPDKSRRDGLRYYCDACVARMERRRYWLAKNAAVKAA